MDNMNNNLVTEDQSNGLPTPAAMGIGAGIAIAAGAIGWGAKKLIGKFMAKKDAEETEETKEDKKDKK